MLSFRSAKLRRILQRTVVLALLGWAGYSLAREIPRAQARTRRLAETMVTPMFWQLGSPQEKRLRFLLGEVAAEIPPGEEVGIVTSEKIRPDQAFFVTLWAAYLLPRHHVRWHPLEAAPGRVRYFVTVRTKLPYPGYELMVKTRLGAVYRLGAERKDVP